MMRKIILTLPAATANERTARIELETDAPISEVLFKLGMLFKFNDDDPAEVLAEFKRHHPGLVIEPQQTLNPSDN